MRSQVRRCLFVAIAAVMTLSLSIPAWTFSGTPGQEAAPQVEVRGKEKVEKASPYEIRFLGNRTFSERKLRKAAADELADFERPAARRPAADDAAFQMELEYRQAGYAFASVDYRHKTIEGKTMVTFLISEGPRVLVREIKLTGNTTFGDKKLLPFFEGEKTGILGRGELVFVESDVRSALSEIRDFYYGEGFLDAKIEGPEFLFSEDRTHVNVSVHTTEGTRHVIRKVELTGDLLREAKPAISAVRNALVGKPYFKRRKLILRSRVIEAYGNLGYPDVEVEIHEREDESPGDVVLETLISSGPQVRISDVSISGNEKTQVSFIRSRLALRSGDLYSLEKKRKSFRELFKAGLFSKVDLELVGHPESEEQRLVVRVEETPSRELFFEPGWGSYELLRMRLGFREKNLLGTGRIVRTEWGASVRGENLLASITDPWFLDTDIVANVPVYFRRREEPSFTRQETGASVLFSKYVTQHLTLTLGYLFRLTRISDIEADSGLEDLDTGYNIASMKSQATLDTRNDIFFPTTGHRSHISAEFSDPVLGSDLAFSRFTAGARHFFSITDSFILALRYDTGFVLPGRDQDTIPLAERFFNGGENTVRSFRESELGPLDVSGDPVGGLAFNVLSIELRHRFSDNLAGTLFFDYGNVSPNRSRTEEGKPPLEGRSELIDATFREYFQDFQAAIGCGLQYLLPIGPARLDFAVNPSPREKRNEDRFVIHFSVGMAF